MISLRKMCQLILTISFLYPLVEISKCIDCKLCDSACPIENKVESKMFGRKAYVLRAKDVGIVSTSTSGGFVTPLGEWILNQGGVICGATYNEEYKVVHKVSGGGQKSFEVQNTCRAI